MLIEEIIEKLQDRNLAEVGRRMNITRAYLSQICLGRKCSEEMRQRLEEYLTK
jgi:plasmid maintenance system antidote protein VapI